MSNDPLVCVRRPQPSLPAVFQDMYLNERLVDVTLSCMDGQLQAHKLVLAASSQYFSSLFEKLANPFHYPVIVMNHMRIDDLKMIVDFMYRGELTVSQERLIALVKSAENLQITGLSNSESNELVEDTEQHDGTEMDTINQNSRDVAQRNIRRGKKASSSASSTISQQHALFNRNYHQSRHHDVDYDLSPQPEKLLEQSMITGESVEDSHISSQYSSYINNHSATSSSRNLNIHQTRTPSASIQHVQQQVSTANIEQHPQHHQHQLNSQLQVLSHSLSANQARSAIGQGMSNGQHSGQMGQQSIRNRMHPCNICWKTFREKANLKRHLQVHSLDRTTYTCRECNKTFSWKDNYIRHTKTAHHISNVRPQA